MTMPGVSCKALATKNSSEWPCSMCPFPQLRLVGVRTSYIYFLIFPGHLEFWTPLQVPIWGPPLGCTLFHFHYLGKKALKLCFYPKALNVEVGPRCPKEEAHKTTLINCLPLVTICFTRESLMLTERAHK